MSKDLDSAVEQARADDVDRHFAVARSPDDILAKYAQVADAIDELISVMDDWPCYAASGYLCDAVSRIEKARRWFVGAVNERGGE